MKALDLASIILTQSTHGHAPLACTADQAEALAVRIKRMAMSLNLWSVRRCNGIIRPTKHGLGTTWYESDEAEATACEDHARKSLSSALVILYGPDWSDQYGFEDERDPRGHAVALYKRSDRRLLWSV